MTNYYCTDCEKFIDEIDVLVVFSARFGDEEKCPHCNGFESMVNTDELTKDELIKLTDGCHDGHF